MLKIIVSHSILDIFLFCLFVRALCNPRVLSFACVLVICLFIVFIHSFLVVLCCMHCFISVYFGLDILFLFLFFAMFSL